MPEFHVGLVELAVLIFASISGFSYLKFSDAQQSKEIETLFKKYDTVVADTQQKHNQLEKELRDKFDNLGGELRKEIGEMNKALARIEGRLESKTHHS